MKLLLINGPNLNRLGQRDQAQYGSRTLAQIESTVREQAAARGFEVVAMQSNHEGALIDFIQAQAADAAGILINPGALTHYGYSLRDAIEDSRLPAVEVHLSDIFAREEWRRHSVIREVCIDQIAGQREKSYETGLARLISHLKGAAA